MQDLKKIEVKNIDVLSVFKFFGGIFLIIGLIIGLFSHILRIDIVSMGITRIFPFTARLNPGILAGIIFGIIYGLSAAIGFSIFALFFNFFAALLGGIKFFVKE